MRRKACFLKASTGKPDARARRRNSKPASSSQGRLKDAYLGGLKVEVAEKLAATDMRQESWDFPESESWSDHEKELTGKPVASRNLEISGNSKAGSRNWPHHFHMSPAVVPRMAKLYSIVRQIYGRSPMDDLNDFDVNNAIWCIFMNVTLQAAVHLGRDFFGESTIYKKKKKPQVSETEIPSDRKVDQGSDRKAVEITNANTYVFSDSVPCLGGITDQPVDGWKDKIKWFLEARYLKDLNRIGGESMEFEWKIFPRIHYVGHTR